MAIVVAGAALSQAPELCTYLDSEQDRQWDIHCHLIFNNDNSKSLFLMPYVVKNPLCVEQQQEYSLASHIILFWWWRGLFLCLCSQHMKRKEEKKESGLQVMYFFCGGGVVRWGRRGRLFSSGIITTHIYTYTSREREFVGIVNGNKSDFLLCILKTQADQAGLWNSERRGGGGGGNMIIIILLFRRNTFVSLFSLFLTILENGEKGMAVG